MCKKILAVVLALLYSFVYVELGPAIQSQNICFDSSKTGEFIVCFLVCSVINILVFSFLPRCRFRKGSRRISQWMEKLGDRRFFLLVWAFILLSWIPAWLLFFPGILSYDIISQVGSAVNGITNNHHPVLHTWLIKAFMNLGERCFSSRETGLGILAVLQMLILSYALARLVLLLKKKDVPVWIVLVTAVLSGFWFMNACLSVTMVKDVLHAAFLVLFACHFTEIVMNPEEYLRKKQNLVFLPVIVFLMCAFRNNGIHIYIFCIAILFVVWLIQRKKIKGIPVLILIMILPAVLFKIYTGPVFGMLDIEQGQVREALCIPIQQLQRVSLYRADELTDEQRERMDYYIDNLEWGDFSQDFRYSPFFADYAKSCFYSGRYEEDPAAFWKFYFRTGKQFTKEYAVAFLSNTLGYWYPGEYNFSYVMYDNCSPEQFAVPLERKSICAPQALETYYQSVCSSGFWRSAPVLRLFFVPGYALWLLIFGLVLAWKGKKFPAEVLPIFLPVIGQFGIMLLSPMASFRYSWPFYLLLPLFFIGIFREREPEPAEECIGKENGEAEHDGNSKEG